MSEKLYLHPLTERVWHWVHAVLVMLLILTGIQIHWPDAVSFFGNYANAINIHNWAGIFLVFDFLLWFFYNLISKRVSHYIIRKHDVLPGAPVQARYYALGIFKNEPHPYTASEENKFNPLQKITYFSFMFFMMPILLISGIFYLFPSIGGLQTIAVIHFIMAIIFVAFLIAHIYMATMGHTVFAEVICMFTGYADKEEHG